MTTKPKISRRQVKLVGGDGNAFAVLGKVTSALRRGGGEKSELDAFVSRATSGNYDNLLATAMRWVENGMDAN